MAIDKEKIRREAKDILDRFSKSLEKVEIEESRVERDEDRREEGEGEESDSDFRRIMFSNAPKKSGECIEAERGEWVK